MLYVNYTDHKSDAVADAEAKDRAQVMAGHDNSTYDNYYNTSSLIVINWLRAFIRQGKLKHTEVTFYYHNTKPYQTNKYGKFEDCPFPEYSMEPIEILLS